MEKQKNIWLISGLILIFVFSLFLRLLGNDWDQGTHLHPDERMLILVTGKIDFPHNLDPDFFNYGSLPIYVLAFSAEALDIIFHTHFDTYDGLLILGRSIATFLDLGTVILVWFIARKLFSNSTISMLAALLYGLSFFAVQNSNFFVVDNFVNFFICFTLLGILSYVHTPSIKWVILSGVMYGASLAVKVTPILFLPALLLLFSVRLDKSRLQFVGFKKWIVAGCVFFLVTLLAHMVSMPYAYLRWDRFVADVSLQLQMNSDAYIFPYTLQYVGTTPYWYYLKNILWWGVGPLIFASFCVGLIFTILKTRSDKKPWLLFIYVGLNLFFFMVIGRSAVKFMRYVLPLYPFIAVIGAYGIGSLVGLIKNRWIRLVIVSAFVFANVFWVWGFMNIYRLAHPRIQASQWMIEHIPAGSVLAVEHWDDRLPLFGGNRYQYEELELYNLPDDEHKWTHINEQLSNSDYVVLASNRLYTPLQKLDDCNLYEKCYPLTADYYNQLLSGVSNFVKVAEFGEYPTVFGFQLNDQGADESFTVYDHPKVMIFKNVGGS